MEKKPIIWVLLDDRAGNNSQSLGVAERLGGTFIAKQIVYNKLASLPNILKGASLVGVDLEKASRLGEPWPDLVISAGRKTASIARYIKKQSGAKLVHMMWPGSYDASDFDLICVPEHDRIKPKKNTIITKGSPNKITEDLLKKSRQKWLKKFSYLPEPRIALLVGGDTKKGRFTKKHASQLAQKLSLFMQGKNGSYLITNSRRTSTFATNTLRHEITSKFYFHDVSSKDENPYLGYLAVCDAIIVCGDSISMCSEACATEKPVYIYSTEGIIPKKHQQFHQVLFDGKYAKPFTGKFEKFKPKRLNDTDKIVNCIKALIKNKSS